MVCANGVCGSIGAVKYKAEGGTEVRECARGILEISLGHDIRLPGEVWASIPTGLSLTVPDGYVGLVVPVGGINFRPAVLQAGENENISVLVDSRDVTGTVYGAGLPLMLVVLLKACQLPFEKN